MQAKLRDQAQSLANRTKARQLDGSGAAFQQFVKEMELAVASMTPASDKLKALAFQDALTPEQQALQHLLRAESTFRADSGSDQPRRWRRRWWWRRRGTRSGESVRSRTR